MSPTRRHFLAVCATALTGGCLSRDKITTDDVSLRVDGVDYGNVFESVTVSDIISKGVGETTVEYQISVGGAGKVKRIEQYVPSKNGRGLRLAASSEYKPIISFTTGLKSPIVNRVVARNSNGESIHEITVWVYPKER